jgi:fructose-1,6-bisphosphatase/inositol monophosphatase family enzyme
MGIFGLIQLVEEAGDILLKIREEGQSGSSLCEDIKPDGTLVTRADFASNDYLLRGVSRAFPNVEIVSEESLHEANGYASHFLIMDPLDGTQAYSDGLDEFSVLLGEVRNGQPLAGIMHFPALKRTLFACTGSVTAMNGTEVKVSSRRTLGESSVSCRKCGTVGDSRIVSHPLDSGYALMQLAMGKIDGVVIKMVTHREWDIVAPTAIILAGGGKVSDERENTITYEKPGINFKYFVASNGHCHQELLGLVSTLS